MGTTCTQILARPKDHFHSQSLGDGKHSAFADLTGSGPWPLPPFCQPESWSKVRTREQILEAMATTQHGKKSSTQSLAESDTSKQTQQLPAGTSFTHRLGGPFSLLQQTLTRPSGLYIHLRLFRTPGTLSCGRSELSHLLQAPPAKRRWKVWQSLHTTFWQCRVPVLRCPASPAVASPLVMPPLLVSFPLLVGFLVRFPLLVTRPAVAGGLRAASQAHEQVGDVSALPKFLISSFRVKTCSVQVFMELIHRANLWR
jgi:hypothetical protein